MGGHTDLQICGSGYRFADSATVQVHGLLLPHLLPLFFFFCFWLLEEEGGGEADGDNNRAPALADTVPAGRPAPAGVTGGD